MLFFEVVLSVNRQDDSETPPFNQENAMESAPLQKKDGPGKLIVWTIIVILWSGILLCYPGNLPVKNLNQHAASIDIGGGVGTPAIVGIDAMENEQSLPFVKNL